MYTASLEIFHRNDVVRATSSLKTIGMLTTTFIFAVFKGRRVISWSKHWNKDKHWGLQADVTVQHACK